MATKTPVTPNRVGGGDGLSKGQMLWIGVALAVVVFIAIAAIYLAPGGVPVD